MIAIAIVSKRVSLEVLGFDVRDFPPARTPDLPAHLGSIPALLATPFWPPRAVILMEIYAFRPISGWACRCCIPCRLHANSRNGTHSDIDYDRSRFQSDLERRDRRSGGTERSR